MAIQSNREEVINIAQRYAKAVNDKLNITDVYLFGSHARGAAYDDSDIDIAVVSDDFTGDVTDDIFTLLKLRRSIDLRIEPHPFTQKDFVANNPFAREIMQTGVLIQSKT